MPPVDLTPLNDREYRKLLLALTLDAQRLELLVAITDDRNLQDQLITAYEADLRNQGIAPLRTRLDPKRPSLRATLEELVAQTSALQAGEPAVVTVLNAGELLGVRLSDDKSEQEKFFFSLQWTREALRNFEFPIVLWLPDAVATRLAQQAPDFWSWRGGVFEFVAEARVPEAGRRELLPMPSGEMSEDREKSPVAIADLQQQIAQLEATAPESPLLITLYNNLGEAYAGEYQYQPALELYEKALTLAEAKSNSAGEARSLGNLGDGLRNCGRPFRAVDYYQQAFEKYCGLSDRRGEAATLNQLGLTSESLGQYPQAIKYYQQSLAIGREICDRWVEAASLVNLGNAYYGLGRYPQAIEYHQQSLVINREIGDREGEAGSLGGLGLVYHELGQSPQAIEYYQQSLAIKREIGDHLGEGAALGNLGIVYCALGQYPQAIEYFQQSLAVKREIGNRQGEAGSLCNLGVALYSLGEYQRAIEYFQESIAISRETGKRRFEANALLDLGNSFARVGQKWDARQAYDAARALFQEMELSQEVEACDEALYNLSQMVVVEPKAAPTLPKSSPTHPQRISIALLSLVGLGIAALAWWLLR